MTIKGVLLAASDVGRHRLNRGHRMLGRWDGALERRSDLGIEQPLQVTACDREVWARLAGTLMNRVHRNTETPKYLARGRNMMQEEGDCSRVMTEMQQAKRSFAGMGARRSYGSCLTFIAIDTLSAMTVPQL